jgi:hypothetical protein
MSEDAAEEEISERAVSVRSLFSRPERWRANDAEQVDEAEEAEEEKEDEPVAPAVVSAVPPPADVDDTQAFVRAYVKDHGIHPMFRWRDYHLQQLEAAGQAWTPKMRHGPVTLRKMIMQWVKNQVDDEEQEDEAEPSPVVAAEEVEMAE